jgi:hypothetical protein
MSSQRWRCAACDGEEVLSGRCLFFDSCSPEDVSSASKLTCFWCDEPLFATGDLLVCPKDGATFDTTSYVASYTNSEIGETR